MPKPDFVTDDVCVAADWIKQGRVLAYPTESVWGLGCNPFDERAVKELLRLKSRAVDKGLIVVTASDGLLQGFFGGLSYCQQEEIMHSWRSAPHERQATTWLFPIPKDLLTPIPTWLTGDKNSLAVRVISHEKIAKLCDVLKSQHAISYGFLVSTSCNPTALPPATDLMMAYEYFGGKVCYLKGEVLGYDKPSQIIDVMTGEVIR